MTTPTDTLQAISLLATRALDDLTDTAQGASPTDPAKLALLTDQALTDIADRAVVGSALSVIVTAADQADLDLSVEVEEHFGTFLRPALDLIRHHLGGDHSPPRVTSILEGVTDQLEALLEQGTADSDEYPTWATVELLGHRVHHGRLRRLDDGLIEVVEPELHDEGGWFLTGGEGYRQVELRADRHRPRKRIIAGRSAIYAITQSDERSVLRDTALAHPATLLASCGYGLELPGNHDERERLDVLPHGDAPTHLWLGTQDGHWILVRLQTGADRTDLWELAGVVELDGTYGVGPNAVRRRNRTLGHSDSPEAARAAVEAALGIAPPAPKHAAPQEPGTCSFCQRALGEGRHRGELTTDGAEILACSAEVSDG